MTAESSERATGCLAARAKNAIPLEPVAQGDFEAWRKRQGESVRQWLGLTGFRAKAGQFAFLLDGDGGPARVLAGVESLEDSWSYAGLAEKLPAGSYRLDPEPDAKAAGAAALGWAIGCYDFARYRAPREGLPRLIWPKNADRQAATAAAESVTMVRDLVNTPANDMGPAELAEAARGIARRFGGKCAVTRGEQLLKKNYPAIHAVGRAAAQEPRLIDLRWQGPGGAKGPKITLVGKGVCFDTGGLDLKPASGMLLMKKDMGGAAHALGLAQWIMASKLPLRLRVLVPAVENSVSGDSYRPGDVIATRKGVSVEVGNTDAEGRIVLCDALAEAVTEKPDMLLDFATLTGAARVALGPELPALFSNSDALAEELLSSGVAEGDPLWRLPLHRPYRQLLNSKLADINNVSSGGFAGAITAALFLQEFVPEEVAWAHIDLMAWNNAPRPGRPVD
ncbi:MAG: leucyl aminopeptidase family protein, partial [Rhodovibrionaceae bacterium]